MSESIAEVIVETVARTVNDTEEGHPFWDKWVEFTQTNDRDQVDPDVRVLWDIIDEGRVTARAVVAAVVPLITAQLRPLHVEWVRHHVCSECSEAYPCPTIRKCDELDALAAALDGAP